VFDQFHIDAKVTDATRGYDRFEIRTAAGAFNAVQRVFVGGAVDRGVAGEAIPARMATAAVAEAGRHQFAQHSRLTYDRPGVNWRMLQILRRQLGPAGGRT
jgi:hypothetical protein